MLAGILFICPWQCRSYVFCKEVALNRSMILKVVKCEDLEKS